MLASVQSFNFSKSVMLQRPRQTERTNLDTEMVGADQFKLTFFLAEQVSVPFKMDTTLQAFHDSLLANEKNNVTSAKFYTLSGSRLPLCEKVGDQLAYPVLLQINDERIFALNFSTQYRISGRDQSEASIYDEELYYDYARDIGLNGYKRFALPYISHKIMRALPPKQQLTSADISSSVQTVMRYMTRSTELAADASTNFDKSKKRLDDLLQQIGEQEKKIEVIEKSAARKSKMILFMSSSVVLAQFALIFQGTFHYLSWDIMEPVCYLMTLGNFTAGYAFYLYQKRDCEMDSFHEILTMRFKESACMSQGIDLAQLEEMKEEVAQIRDELRLIV